MTIPHEAVDAAARSMSETCSEGALPWHNYLVDARLALEAALPFLLSNEVEQTRLVSTLEAKLDALRSFADEADDHSISPSDLYKILDGDT